MHLTVLAIQRLQTSWNVHTVFLLSDTFSVWIDSVLVSGFVLFTFNVSESWCILTRRGFLRGLQQSYAATFVVESSFRFSTLLMMTRMREWMMVPTSWSELCIFSTQLVAPSICFFCNQYCDSCKYDVICISRSYVVFPRKLISSTTQYQCSYWKFVESIKVHIVMYSRNNVSSISLVHFERSSFFPLFFFSFIRVFFLLCFQPSSWMKSPSIHASLLIAHICGILVCPRRRMCFVGVRRFRLRDRLVRMIAEGRVKIGIPGTHSLCSYETSVVFACTCTPVKVKQVKEIRRTRSASQYCRAREAIYRWLRSWPVGNLGRRAHNMYRRPAVGFVFLSAITQTSGKYTINHPASFETDDRCPPSWWCPAGACVIGSGAVGIFAAAWASWFGGWGTWFKVHYVEKSNRKLSMLAEAFSKGWSRAPRFIYLLWNTGEYVRCSKTVVNP